MSIIEILLDASIKALVVLAIAGVVNLALLRRSSAARRHLVWSVAAAGALVMPLLSLALPAWQVLPVWANLMARDVVAVESAPSPVEPIVGERATPPPPVFEATPALEPVSSPAPMIDEPVVGSTERIAWSWRRLALLGWLLVAALALAPVLLGMWSLRRLERDARRIDRGPLAEHTDELAEAIGLKRSPRLLESPERPMPMHWGILRSRLLLPAGASEWPRARLRLVLLHELAHARRRDCLTHLLIELACALYWFNPLTWLARARMREEREVACDDLVLRSGLAASDYAEELLRVATGHQTPLFAGRAAIAMARPRTLERRLRAILDARRDRRVAGRVMLGVAAAACALVLPPLAMVRAGEVESAPAPEGVETVVDEQGQAGGRPPGGQLDAPYELQLGAHVFRLSGIPTESCSVTFWRAREAKGEETLPWDEEPMTGWREGLTGPCWEPIEHVATSDRARIVVPEPGTYRVTAYAGHGQPAEFGDSGPIEVGDRSALTIVPVVLDGGPRHVVEVIDVRTRKPLEGAEIFLVRSDGLPLAPWSSGWGIRAGDRTYHFFEHLAPGEYTLHARIRAQRYGLPDYRLDGGPRKLRIKSGVETRSTLELRVIERDDFEVARRWPWSVFGTVSDPEGKPLVDVEISVHCGMGTLLLQGKARTDHEGHYSVRFGPGTRTLDDETGEWITPLQAATVSPSKPGWYERDLHRGGDLTMASKRPEADNAWSTGFYCVVLPDQPHRLDFVMRLAAKIVGQLQDDHGVPIEGESLSLGAAELWPSSSVLHWTETDEHGNFTFDPVPPRAEVWFELGRRKSEVFKVTGPGQLRVRVRRAAGGGLDVVQITSSDEPGPSAFIDGSGQVIDHGTGGPPKPFRLAARGAADGVLRRSYIRAKEQSKVLHGRIVDHSGHPVSGAEVFFTSEVAIDIENGAVRGSSERHQVTDAEGRFVLEGAGERARDSIVVLAPHLHAFLLPSLSHGKTTAHVANLQLSLPEPATLVLRYDIPGDLDEAEIRAQLATWDMPEWRGKLECTQRVSVEQGGEVVLSNLLPGTYDISRDKGLRASRELGHTAMCDRQTMVLGSGERQIVEFVRKRGARVSGRVLGLEKTAGWKAIVYIREADASGDPMGQDWQQTTFDGQVTGEDGNFETALLEPGEYLAVAHVYKPLTEQQRHSTGWILPSLVGTARFTVPGEGSPAALEVEMVRFEPK